MNKTRDALKILWSVVGVGWLGIVVGAIICYQRNIITIVNSQPYDDTTLVRAFIGVSLLTSIACILQSCQKDKE